MSDMSERATGGLRARGGAMIPLAGVELTGTVLAGYVKVLARQRYVNREAQAVEAVYVFPLPADATLDGFAMSCDGRRVEGVVQEKEQAFRTYDDAVLKGHGAALLEQERPNVFTANVGNLLPGEETLVEVSYLQRLHADEGSLRVQIPTLVAPRYIPGSPDPSLAHTGHGERATTTRVPDADRITPKWEANIPYGVSLALRFELGSSGLVVESPSHAIVQEADADGVTVVRFARGEEALDRDLVLTARGVREREPLVSVRAHRAEGESEGVVALSVVPDLLGALGRAPTQRVVFLVDTSGSMDGASLPQAKTALRLCLRQLREGDRFDVIEFNTSARAFAGEPVALSQTTLSRADAWVGGLNATGGTELREPLLEAVKKAGPGIVVLLTDGQVGNEDEILRAVLAACEQKKPRIYTLGIGTNVSDALLKGLARGTGGAAEFIHPGERIDEKVVSVFAKALAPRVRGVGLKVEGVTLGERAPQALPDMVDGEPWTVFGRYDATGAARAVLTGTVEGEEFTLAVPMELPAFASAPVLKKLWASERLRDLEALELTGRRAGAMKERMIALAVEAGLASKYTSFVVVEKREGDRRAEGGNAVTRAVPVNAPAGWAAKNAHTRHPSFAADDFDQMPVSTTAVGAMIPMGAPPSMPAPMRPMASMPRSASASVGEGLRSRAMPSFGGSGATPISRDAGARAKKSEAIATEKEAEAKLRSRRGSAAPFSLGELNEEAAMATASAEDSYGAHDDAAPIEAKPEEAAGKAKGGVRGFFERMFAGPAKSSAPAQPALAAPPGPAPMPASPVRAEPAKPASPAVVAKPKSVAAASPERLLATQLASGLFPASGPDANAPEALVRATTDALATLLAAGITTAHAVYKAPLSKAVEALTALAATLVASHPTLAAEALAIAWLVASGRHTRGIVEKTVRGISAPPSPVAALTAALGDEGRVRALLPTG